MPLEVKICGVNASAAAKAAAKADFVGFVFYPPSPRHVTPQTAAKLAALLPATARKVGLFVDAADDTIAAVLREVSLDLLQFHGDETPARVGAAGERFALPVMKALKIASAEDLDAAEAYLECADRLLFDAKAGPSAAPGLPGGSGRSFDWSLLAGRAWPRAWMLSGGLNPENLAAAVGISGARAVDVSSGVEAAPGQKSPERIRAFLDEAARL